MDMRKKQLVHQLKGDVNTVSLTAAEKQAGRESLSRVMAHYPLRVRESTLSRHLWQRGWEEEMFPTFSLLLTRKTMFATLIIALSLLVSGGVTYAAEGSLPGDPLYSVKVHVNEPVLAALATSAEASANWDTRRAERRLEEASVLAAAGKLDGDTRATLEEKIQVHTERVKARIERFEKEGKDEQAAHASARLEASLKIHERILDKIAGEKDDSVHVEVGPLLETIRAEVQETKHARKEAEAKVKAQMKTYTEQAARGRREAAENKIRQVRRFVGRANLSVEIRAKAEAKLSEAEEVLAKGDVALAAMEYTKAFIQFGKAHEMAQEVQAFAQAHAELRVRLPARVRIEVDFDEDTEVDVAEETDDREDEDGDKKEDDKNGGVATSTSSATSSQQNTDTPKSNTSTPKGDDNKRHKTEVDADVKVNGSVSSKALRTRDEGQGFLRGRLGF